ncbi:MAG: hypothetical protein NTV56_08860 [Alphaproteobacteria bacterium]|nr:hypothetical protein [Alphaproteobacteria bacterium]
MYAIGGYAFGRQSTVYNGLGNGTPFSFGTAVLTGWDIGAGADFRITTNLIARIEYRHYDFGGYDLPPTFPGFAAHRQTTVLDTIRTGLSYKF